MTRTSLGVLGCLGALLLGLTPARSVAQQTPTERTAAARSLFEQGVECFDDGDLTCAEDRFRRSLALRSSSSARFNLAEVLQRRGAVVEPHELMTQVADDEAAPAELRRLAAETARLLAPLTVSLLGPAEGVGVWIDATRLADALVGVPFPTDPGPRRVEARRGDEVLRVERITLDDGERRALRLDLETHGGGGVDPVLVGLVVGLGAAVLVGAGVAIGVAVDQSGRYIGNLDPPGTIEL